MPEMSYTADATTLGSLLSNASSQIYVPEWQRSYSWGSNQVEVFWLDLTRFMNAHPGDTITGQSYFLGSVVIVNAGERGLLLDGQQRLATSTILLAALRETRRPLRADASTRLQSKYIADFDDATSSTRYSLTLNQYDEEFFRKGVQTEGSVFPDAKLRSHLLIRRAFEFFIESITAAVATKTDQESLTWNLRLEKVLLNHMSVVEVRSDDEDEAASVFEALNDRGIGLSTPDLLRTLLIRKAPDAPSRGQIVESWREVFSLLEEAGVDQFLRHYWVSLRGDVKTRSLYREIKATESFEENRAVEFSNKLAEAAVDYRALKDAIDSDDEVRRHLEAIRDLGANVLFPALLSAIAVRETASGSLALFVRSLVILFVRYTVILGRESTKLEATIYEVAKQLRSGGDYEAAVTSLRQFAPLLSDFRKGFSVAVVSRANSAKYILGELEMSRRATDELRLDNGKRVQLEHIYPQKPVGELRLPAHAALINRVGNLTLLDHRLNAEAKNSDFRAKRTTWYQQSQLLLTQELAGESADVWGEAEIARRQNEMAIEAAEVWAFDSLELDSLLAQDAAGIEEAVLSENPDTLPEDEEVGA